MNLKEKNPFKTRRKKKKIINLFDNVLVLKTDFTI